METAARNTGWREAFLNRHRNVSEDGEGGELSEPRGEPRPRSLSRPRSREVGASISGGKGVTEAFDQKAVLDQDRALIEQLTQRQPRGERSAVRKPPPPPKVAPYKGSFTPILSPSDDRRGSSDAAVELKPPMAQAVGVGLTAGTTTGMKSIPPASAADFSQTWQPATAHTEISHSVPAAAGVAGMAATLPAAAPLLNEPVVPRTGHFFTASDIDSMMDLLGGDGATSGAYADVKSDCAHPNVAPPTDQCTQNFGDISEEFFHSHRMEVPIKVEATTESREACDTFGSSLSEEKVQGDFEVPQRKALKAQISAIDSWLDDSLQMQEQLDNRRHMAGNSVRTAQAASNLASAAYPTAPGFFASSPANEVTVSSGRATHAEPEVFQKLEDVKRRKALGERASPLFLKEVAAHTKPLLPGMPLEKLVRVLQLFTSARYEDHDLYLRILGEIPVQVRGISPETLTTCLRVLWRLRLHEETYLELFSMEAMNMIRAERRPNARAPRRPPNPSRKFAAASTSQSEGPVPVPPSTSPQEVLAPFSAAQLIQIGNALSQLGAKHHTRFLDVFQEQLAVAIPRLTEEECELVSPILAMSQLMHDPLRRAFLERCAQVGAGRQLPSTGMLAGTAAPDIAEYQHQNEARRRRTKHFRNIYVIEASVRKETFSFFSSLPLEVRGYLDRLRDDAAALQHEGPTAFASQIAAVLDQLGVSCDMRRMAGPLSLSVVAKATNPRAECEEVVYECSDAAAYYAVRQDDNGAAPQHTACAKLRHRLLQRLGIQLTHISIWEWQQLSEAQRINYMVKLQSLQ